MSAEQLDECLEAPPTREVSEEDAAAGLATIRSHWEMAAVLRFLATFKPLFRHATGFTASELEEELVRSVGVDGLLAQLHRDLLACGSSSHIGQQLNWAALLCRRFEAAGADVAVRFNPRKGRESDAYASLAPTDRRVPSVGATCFNWLMVTSWLTDADIFVAGPILNAHSPPPKV